jgi:hypothetical protein
MSDLEPCPACRRHVRVDESACPFCGGALEASAPRSLAAGRLTRAAVFAGAALAGATGCGGKQKTDPNGNGVGNEVVVDAGVEQAAPPDAQPYREPDHNIPMPYGAPPARQRLV